MKEETKRCANCDEKNLETWYTTLDDRRPFCEKCAVDRFKKSRLAVIPVRPFPGAHVDVNNIT